MRNSNVDGKFRYKGPIKVGGHTIELVNVNIDKSKSQSEYTYNIKSGRRPAISHWVLGFIKGCGKSNIVISASDSQIECEWTESDPRTKVRGIKFDNGYEDLETREVKITLKGIFYPNVSEVAFKAGRLVNKGKIIGPSCSKE